MTDGDNIELTWNETGGPATKPPEAIGFGTRLIQSTVQGIGGEINYDWKPQGLQALLKLPISALKS